MSFISLEWQSNCDILLSRVLFDDKSSDIWYERKDDFESEQDWIDKKTIDESDNDNQTSFTRQNFLNFNIL